jgi:predicted DNA-binding protein
MRNPLESSSYAHELAEGADLGLPPPDTAAPMVSRSLRLPLELDQVVREAAAARGIPPTTLMRQFIEAGVADLSDDALVPLAEVRRLLATLATHPAA